MIQADSVHSTPPTDTSSVTRRNMIGGIATAGAAGALPAIAVAPAAAADPIFSVIETHRKDHAAHIASIELQDCFQRRYGAGSGGWITERPCCDEDDSFVALVAAPAMTVQGLSAKLAYFDELAGDFETEWMVPERAEAAVLIQSFTESLKNIGVLA
jgi:hypothetical protein